MNPPLFIRLKFGIILLLIWSLCFNVQGAPPVKQMQQDAIREMKAGNWEKAHGILLMAVHRFGNRDLQMIDPHFGWLWYHRGYCEIRLEKFEDAMKSFEVCYKKFKNVLPRNGQPQKINRHHKKSLLMWGHAAKGAGEWATSIRMYKKFLAERDPDQDHYEQGIFHINMAINHYKLGKITEGNHHLEVALKGKTTFPTPNKGIMAAFGALAEATVEKKDEVANFMLPKLRHPSKQNAVCLFVLGGSKHYLGMFHDARFLLNHYIETYKNTDPDKLRVQAASYLQAANYSRLQEWTKSAELLDRFFKDYPDPKTNVYFPFALFDRATCHYAKGENRPALAKANQILSDFPEVSFIEQTLALKGNILESLRKFQEAEQCYIKALTLAEKKGNDLVAGECLFYLIALLGKDPIEGEPNPRLAEVIPYYNHFWEHYGNKSPFHAKVAVAGIPAMRKAGKIDEAFASLQSVIRTIALHPGAPGLEEAIGSYTAEYLGEYTVGELAEHYFNETGHSPRLIRAASRYAIIHAYEQALEVDAPGVDGRRAKAMTRVLFKELQSDFALQDLPNFILVKMGDFIRKETPHLQSAQDYYEEALHRPQEQSHKFAALLGLAHIKTKGGKSRKLEAIKLLQRVIDDSNDLTEQEEARHLTTSIHLENGNYDQAIASAKEYLSEPKFRQYRADIQILLAVAHDKAGHVDDALSAYQQIFVSSTTMAASKKFASAIHRWMELLWKRNKSHTSKSDRQIAYEGGYKFLRMTATAVKKASPEEKAIWEKIFRLFSTYEASPDTTKIEVE